MSHLLALATLLVVASAVPFLPTGEIVAGSLAWQGSSVWLAVATFVVSWVASFVGDTALFVQSRLVAARVRPRWGRRVRPRWVGALRRVGGAPVTGMVMARLIPGARAPMIIGLALTRTPGRTFLVGDAIGTGLWAALYTGIGVLSARFAGEPWVAVVVAVTAALLVGVVGARFGGRHDTHPASDAAHAATSPATSPATAADPPAHS